MPVALPGVALAFDVVSEGCTLREWVLALVRSQARVATLQMAELLKGSSEGSLILLLEQGLCLSGNCTSRDKKLSAI